MGIQSLDEPGKRCSEYNPTAKQGGMASTLGLALQKVFPLAYSSVRPTVGGVFAYNKFPAANRPSVFV